MKIVKILGGLGNQMFQYAFYLALKERYPNEEIYIDTSCFRNYPLHNGYELAEIFDIDAKEANFYDKLKIAYPYQNYHIWQIGKYILPKRKTMYMERKEGGYDNLAFQVTRSCYYDGYWQDEQYFKDIKDKIIQVFTPKKISSINENLISNIANKTSLSIHVRRGDYIGNSFYDGICTLAYYEKAIKKILDSINIDFVCIFSNDIDWCKQTLAPLLKQIEDVVYVNWNKGQDSYQDIFLMSACKHNIVANSSFSWWGAWLNQNKDKIVICPSKWNNITNSQFQPPKEWIKI